MRRRPGRAGSARRWRTSVLGRSHALSATAGLQRQDEPADAASTATLATTARKRPDRGPASSCGAGPSHGRPAHLALARRP
ncbi:hypothetical protein DVA67_009215 [Solirubrobacter sp. CPCC 204708]|nr:hypothetical protein [Solirubrobacter deserti]